MKRISSLLLSFLMLFTLLPTAALAEGEQGSSGPQTPYLQMECNSDPQSSFSLPSGTYEVRFYIKDGPSSPYPAYPTNEQITLTSTGAVTNIAYSRSVTGTNDNQEPFTAYYWTMTVSDTAGSGSISGTLKMDENTTIDLGSVTVTSTGKQAKSGTFAIQYNDVSYSAGGEATLTLPAGEHTVALTVTDNGKESFLDTLDFVAYGGCISEIKKGDQQNGVQFWKITVSADGDGIGYIQYHTENNRVTISRGSSQGGQGSTPPAGTLTLWYNGKSYTNSITLPAGTYPVVLEIPQEGKDAFELSPNQHQSYLAASGAVTLGSATFNGNSVTLWTVTVAETGDATGTITYTAPGGTTSTITITRKSTYGAAVQNNDRVEEDPESNSAFYWDNKAHGAIAVPFTYNNDTYYLGTCEWDENGSSISPKGHGSRGLTRNETLTMSVRVFDLTTGSASGADASYTLREDIRAAMLADGYTFDLIVRPTENGCRYYPAKEPAERSIQIGENTYTDSAWSALTFDKAYCAGCWVFEGQLWKDNVLIASSTASERMSRMDTIHVSLTGNSVEQLNAEIAAEAAKYTNLSELESPRVMFTLPGGEFTGELVIPKSSCFITLSGAGARSNKISTTIKGGVKIEGNQMVSVDSIRFVGAGKAAKTTTDGKPNSALYGKGEGIPNRCILEDYYCAVQSTERTVWGASSSVFRNNHIGIHASAAGDGNMQLRNTWFVGNDIALQADAVRVAAITPSGCCFVNNGEDLRNNSTYDLWLSGNYFYHASVLNQVTGGSAWEPKLWSEEPSVITLNFVENTGKLEDRSGRTPIFDNAQNYFLKEFSGVVDQLLYAAFLPVVKGESRTFAMPLACKPDCSSVYYPRFSLYKPTWWNLYPLYPYVTPENQKVTAATMDAGVYVGTEDNETLVIFDFGASMGTP